MLPIVASFFFLVGGAGCEGCVGCGGRIAVLVESC